MTPRSLRHAARCAGLLLVCCAWLVPSAAQERPEVAGPSRPYSPLAPWNLSIATLLSTTGGSSLGEIEHPQSARLVARLWHDTDRPNNFNFGHTYAVYRLDDSNRHRIVNLPVRSRRGWGNLDGGSVPWDPAWSGAGDHPDRQIIIWDERDGREWNLWQVDDGALPHALLVGNGNLVKVTTQVAPGAFEIGAAAIDYRSYEGPFPPSRGAGVPYGAMLVTQQDVERGSIDHALSLRVPITSGRRFVSPAAKLENRDGIDGIPEGSRFAIRLSDEQIESWAAAQSVISVRHARMLARALVDYGFFVTDTAWGGRHVGPERTPRQVASDIRARRTAANLFDIESEATATMWAEIGFTGRDFRDLLDSLLQQEDLWAIREFDYYGEQFRRSLARADESAGPAASAIESASDAPVGGS